MSRVRKSKLPKGEEVEINKVRGMIRAELNKRHGGVVEFLDTEAGKKLGGRKIRPYLYDSGTVNYKVISSLCEYLGIGTLTRKIVVTRSYFYHLVTSVPE